MNNGAGPLYVKTTEQIRSEYANMAYTGEGVDWRLQDFDLWLRAHDEEVKGQAYARIVNAMSKEA